MQIRNRSGVVIRVAGLSIPPNRIASIAVEDYRDWLDRARANRELAARAVERIRTPVELERAPPASPDPSESRHDRLIAAMENLDRENEANWNSNGAPKLSVLRASSGIADLTAGERDELWPVVSGS